MQVQTTRFGTIQVTGTDLILFKEGLLGFADLRHFILLDDPGDEIFAWLQSCERPELAFPVLEPELFIDSYGPKFTKTDFHSVGAESLERGVRLLTIVTIPEDATQMTANLKAPLLVNVKDRVARQIVVQENDYQIKYPMFLALQKRLVLNPTASLKSSAADWGVTVRLPALSSESGRTHSI